MIREKVEDYVRTIPDFPQPGIMFRDITSILQDPDGLAMAIDVLDYTFTDINGLLYRNGIGVQMFQFPEVAAARRMLSDLADMEQAQMPEYKRKEYVAESDRLWEHLKQRTAVYVRKIDRIEAAQEKAASSGLR